MRNGDVAQAFELLILNVYATELLRLLTPGMFIQTGQGLRFSRNPDGAIGFLEDAGAFEGESGSLHREEPEDSLLLYQSIESLSDLSLVVGKIVAHASVHTSYIQRTVGMLLLVVVSVALTFAATALYLRKVQKLGSVQEAMIRSLALLAKERDQETGNHLERVSRFSALLGRELGKGSQYRRIITSEFVEDIALAGPLHDIGKVGIPDSILLKAGSLNDKEWQVMQTHVQIGAEIIHRVVAQYGLRDRYLNMAKNVCAYHHERYDGRGYLEGLKGEEIPLEARIFALADSYDAIRSKRPYKEALSHEEAIRRIREAAGQHFDPALVEAFLRCKKEFRDITETLAD